MPDALIPLTAHQHSVTLLPRFTTDLPFFYLTKKRELLRKRIDFLSADREGRPIHWKVTPNLDEEIGAPGIDAHEVWVRLIKPAIDEAQSWNQGKISSIVPLGSVRHCLRTAGRTLGGWEAKHLFRNLKQIGAAWCEADFWLPTSDIDEAQKPLFKHIRGSFSRMSLYAIGDKHITDDDLRSGRINFDFDLEDTVYIQLHPLEVQMQQSQPQRPIDNEYLFSVSPAERRWLELLQPLFFGVTNNPQNTRGYCEIRYSWYVKRHHTLKQHAERKRVVQQMNELIKDHLRFGYIMRVDYRPVIEGMFSDRKVVDYIIRYFPGKGAIESTKRIKSRLGKENFEQLRLNLISPLQEEAKRLYFSRKPENQKTRKEEKKDLKEEEQELLAKLLNEGIFLDTAEGFVREKPEEAKRQLEYLPFRSAEQNKAGFLRRAIEQAWIEPDGYKNARRKKARVEISEDEKRRRDEEIQAELEAEQEADRKTEEKLAALSPEDYARLYEEAKAKIRSMLTVPHIRAELEDARNEHWQRTIRTAMIRRLQGS